MSEGNNSDGERNVDRSDVLDEIGGAWNGNGSNGTRRRNFLKGLGVSGLVLGGIPFVGRGGDGIEIVLTRNADGTPSETTTVPRKWYERTKNAERRAEKLTERLLDEGGVASVGVGKASTSTGGLRDKAIEVGLWGEEADVAIPENVGGTPVNVSTNVRYQYTYCYTGSYSPLKAGVSVGSDYGRGTTCSRVIKNGNEYLLTARHTFTSTLEACTEESVANGAPVYRNGTKIGEIAGSSMEHDMVYADLTVNIDDGIVDETATIEGHVTQDGLSTLQSNGDTLERRGITTCATECSVSTYDESWDCPDSNIILTEQVHYDTSTLSDDGDSGGPIYYVDDAGDAYMVGMTSGNKTNVDCGWFCTKDVVFGAAAYAMTKSWSGDFAFN